MKPKKPHSDTTVPPLPEGSDFKDALRAFLKTGAPPKNLGRPKAKKRKAALHK
jgi:hypothetical protein